MSKNKKKENEPETLGKCMSKRGVHSCADCCRVNACQRGLNHLHELGLIGKKKAVKPDWNEEGIFRIIGEMVRSALYDYLRKEPTRKKDESKSDFANRHAKWEVEKTNAWIFLNSEFIKKTGLNVQYLVDHQRAINARHRSRHNEEEDYYYYDDDDDLYE